MSNGEGFSHTDDQRNTDGFSNWVAGKILLIDI